MSFEQSTPGLDPSGNGDKPRILVLGPARDAVSGVSTHLNQLFGSSLASLYSLMQLQVGSEGRAESGLQKMIRFAISPAVLALRIIRTRPHIVHLNTSIEPKSFWRDAVYLLVCKGMGRKVIYQVHGGELPNSFFQGNRWLTAFMRWLLARPEAVVLLAQCETHVYEEFASIKCLRTIPNAVDLEEFLVGETKLFREPIVTFGYIGRLAEDKGIFDIVEALGILRRNGSLDFRFQVAGTGPAEAALREAVIRNGLDESTVFLGPVFDKDKLEFWRSTDIFLFPTYHREGLPYTVLESLASGTPMITTRVGGIPDAVSDGIHGRFVRPRAPSELAVTIEATATDRKWLRAASSRCGEQAREHYCIERLARQFSEVYQAVLR